MESGHRFDAQTLHSFIQAVFRQMGSEEQEAKLIVVAHKAKALMLRQPACHPR